MKINRSFAKEILFGTAIGDSLGVPVEFIDRATLQRNPVTDLRGFGIHQQPAGTWSDDSSLTFCLAESLCSGYSLRDLAHRFVMWLDSGYWTPYGEVFDIGITTRNAIENLKRGVAPLLAGETGERSNGNGSLMRILPLLPWVAHLGFAERIKIVGEVSSLTHGHPRSVLGCLLLLEYALELRTKGPKESLFALANRITDQLNHLPALAGELPHYHRIIHYRKTANNPITSLNESPSEGAVTHLTIEEPAILGATINEICSDGYVVHTLEAAIWCLLHSNNFEEAVLMSVNLGSDSDTTGAVTGALAAIQYGFEAIPKSWIDHLARHKDIEALAGRMEKMYS